MSTTLKTWTVNEYHQLIEAGILDHQRVELLLGQIIQITPEKPLHSDKRNQLAKDLTLQLGRQAHVREGRPITLSASELEPDIVIAHPTEDCYEQRHPHPDDICWVIEVADTSLEIDLGEKRQAYALAGIPEYWVVDLRHGKVIVMRHPQGSDYGDRQDMTTGDIMPLAFPEMRFPLAGLLEG